MKLFNKLKFITVTTLIFQPEVFANQNYSQYYPNYFQYIHYPTDYQFVYQGYPVTVIDSQITPLTALNINQTFYHNNYTAENVSQLNYLHGTAMASIIGANYYQTSEGLYYVGICPSIEIINRVAFPNANYPISIYEATQAAVATNNEHIINISAGDKGTKNASQWNDLLIKIGQDNKILIIASVGNDGRNINETLPDDQYWPAAYKPKKKENIEYDPVIRVSSINYENNQPARYQTRTSGSRYGKGRVDLGAPGFNIPFLNPEQQIQYANGTSEAAAIVTGVVATIKNCRPHSTASEVKKILIEAADEYPHLYEEITNGKVLNAQKAINKACRENIQTEATMLYTYEAMASSEQENNSVIITPQYEEFSSTPVNWNIYIANSNYDNFLLTDVAGLNLYSANYKVVQTQERVNFYLTESGQILTTDGHRESLPLCLTASAVESASWQQIGFRPCSNELQMYQKWDLDFISDYVNSNNIFHNANLKLKNSNICLRMKNSHFHWGNLFVANCNEYYEDEYSLKLRFKPSYHGKAKISSIDYDYFKLASGTNFVAPDDQKFAALFSYSEYKFRYDSSSMRIVGYNTLNVNYNLPLCLNKKDGYLFQNKTIDEIKNSYTYLEIKQCHSTVIADEQFYLVQGKTNNPNEFKIFSLLHVNHIFNFQNVTHNSQSYDMANAEKNLCTGSHKNYLWMGGCQQFVINKWNEESYFHWSY